MTYDRSPRCVSVPADPGEAYQAALKTAMAIVGYRDNTEAQLRDKLTERGYPAETVEAVVSRMIAKGYVDDERMMIRPARLLAERKGYGKRRIRQELALKKFRPETLAALDWSCEELADLDFAAICVGLIEKRGGTRDEKTYAFLLRRGHSPSDIRDAYRRIAEKAEDDGAPQP